MRRLEFNQVGNATGQPKLNRPVSREMVAVPPPADLADGSSTALPVVRDEAAADDRPKA